MWCRARGCPWDNTRICEQAAKGKHLDLLKWGRAQGCPWEYDRVKAWASLNGDQKMIAWLEGQAEKEMESDVRRLAP